jgi:hypothetical protein
MAWKESDGCPFCGAPVSEVGGLSCCGAITADCVGRVDGVIADEIDFEADAPAEDRLIRHSWYEDTLLPAPQEWDSSAVNCRCGG